jgi:hypothetical protein
MRYRPEFFETIIVQSVPLWYMKLNTFATPLEPSYMYVRQHTSAYVSIRQHTSAYVSIRQHTSAYVVRSVALWCMRLSIRQHTSAYVSIRQHTSAYVSIRSAVGGAVVHAAEHVLRSARAVLRAQVLKESRQ